MANDSRILDLLDGWRDLPAYQLERRADVFLAAFLPQVLSFRYRTVVRQALIPEFPLHLRTLHPSEQLGHDLPCRLDYLAISDDLATAYFIELKTDPKSKDKTQFANMAAAKKAGFRSIMRGLLKVVEASEEKHKYCCLLRLLAQHGLITLPDSLAQALQSRHYRTAVNACLPMIALAEIDPEVKLIYVEPIATTSDDIGFVEFAGWLDKLKDDDLAQRLSLSLKRWVASPAGR